MTVSPFADELGWSKMYIGGMWSPGTMELSGHTRKVGWDVKQASGQDGGTSTRKGGEVPQFDADFYLVDDPVLGNDFDEWPAFQKMLEDTIRGDKPKAVPVIHPDLNRNYITEACLRSMGEMKPDGRGGASIRVGFIEFKPPKPKPAAPPEKATETEGDRRIREAQEELEGLLEEGENL